MEFPKDRIQNWVNELRSGKWSQARDTLQKGNSFCCLGVLCKLEIPEKLQYLDFDNQLMGQLPENQPKAPGWVREIDDDFASRTPGGDNLSWLNDDPNFTFEDIADEIERVYLDPKGVRPKVVILDKMGKIFE